MAAGQKLVREAMTHLKMRTGASLAQIRNQIASSYTGKIDVKKRGVLTSALKGLLEKGQVEKKGVNYTLLARSAKLDAGEDDTVPGRRHRRRRRRHGGAVARPRRRRRTRRRRRRRKHSRRRRRGHHKRRRLSRRTRRRT